MYSQIFELQADFLKALAHPRRLEIIHLLRDQVLCVTDIYEMLDLPQANISQHLMLMREAGIVNTKRVGKKVMYELAHPQIIQASDLWREILIEKYHGTVLAEHLALSMNELVPVEHDPVCQMRVSPKTAGESAEFQGQRYFFCASGCRTKFLKHPEVYVKN